jgi:redox-sensitive bicupin YhaK (pirin superfamily)
VLRVLPAVERRLVGPFIFFDHFGPATFAAGRGLDVRPHPHINLATVTYLFEGEIVHKDSLGSDQAIRPGDVNWMTAGRGIVHSERTSAAERATGASVHGLQSWVALPKSHEEDPPSFVHHGGATIPEQIRDGVRLRIVAGTAFGAESPVRVFAPTLYVDARLDAGAELGVPDEHSERAAYVVEGEIEHAGTTYGVGNMLVFREGAAVQIRAVGPARVMLVGGAKMDGPRHIWWNFVSSSKERIEQAKADWREGRFDKVFGDEKDFIPLPD